MQCSEKGGRMSNEPQRFVDPGNSVPGIQGVSSVPGVTGDQDEEQITDFHKLRLVNEASKSLEPLPVGIRPSLTEI